MGMYLNPGNDAFAAVTKGLYVDKTGIIEYINNTLGTKDNLTCVSRPRRFGKSFTAKMLAAYYDKSCDSSKLFNDLRIAKSDIYKKYLNQYNVLYLDITSFISVAKNIKSVVKDITADVLRELKAEYPNLELGDSLIKALVNIAEQTGEKFIVIIDEWDALFREARYDSALQEEYIQLLRSLFKNGVLTSKAIEGAYMTGILPIKKYGTQSALTDFREYTMLQPGKLAEYIGFTEKEVRALCREHSLNFKKVKAWYDGYSFSRFKSIYNPNSVMEAIRVDSIDNFWTRTETYEALQGYIDLNEYGLKEAVAQLLAGNKLQIDTGTFQNDMTSINSKDDVLTLLIHLGYLAFNNADSSVYVPNEEIEQEFMRALRNSAKHQDLVKLIRKSEQVFEYTLGVDGEKVAQLIEEVHDSITTPEFYNNEQALKSVIRFAYLTCIDEYLKIEELPSGKGYADVAFIPKKGTDKPALLVELKWNKSAVMALEQIKKKNYIASIKGCNEILLVGINYDSESKKHSCIIEKIVV